MFYRFVTRHRTFVLEWYECGGPFERQEIAHTAEMLAKLDEDGTVFLNCSKGTIGTALVTRFEKRRPLILIVWSVVKRNSIASRFGDQQADPSLYQTIKRVDLLVDAREQCASHSTCPFCCCVAMFQVI